MVEYIFTFVVPVKLPFFDYDELLDLMCKDLKNERNIDFFYSVQKNYKYRIMMMHCTRKKAEEVCNILDGYQIRELDPFTANCFMEIMYGIQN